MSEVSLLWTLSVLQLLECKKNGNSCLYLVSRTFLLFVEPVGEIRTQQGDRFGLGRFPCHHTHAHVHRKLRRCWYTRVLCSLQNIPSQKHRNLCTAFSSRFSSCLGLSEMSFVHFCNLLIISDSLVIKTGLSIWFCEITGLRNSLDGVVKVRGLGLEICVGIGTSEHVTWWQTQPMITHICSHGMKVSRNSIVSVLTIT